MSASVNLCGVELSNPTVLASGVLGISAASLRRVADSGAGAVTMKSVSLEEKKGYETPVIVDVRGGILNAVGLPSPGVGAAIEEIKEYKRTCKTPLILSVQGHSMEDYVKVVEATGGLGVDYVELNTSCPHVYKKPISHDPEVTSMLVEKIKKISRAPVFVKLSPNTPNIVEVAIAAEKAGADGVTAINTVGPGMVINIKVRAPVLSNKSGGMSGPAIKPIAIRCVYDIYEAVKIPIIGVGGVVTAEDTLEMIMAGATAVGVGTAISTEGLDVFKKITNGVTVFMENEGYSKIKDMVGAAHG